MHGRKSVYPPLPIWPARFAMLDETSFFDSDEGKNSTRFDMNTGWVWYRLPVFADEGVTIAVSLEFHVGQPSLVQVCDLEQNMAQRGKARYPERQ